VGQLSNPKKKSPQKARKCPQSRKSQNPKKEKQVIYHSKKKKL
jgi:hypothetical protein